MPEFLIIIAVLVGVAVLAGWALRTFKPEIERAKRIRRSRRGGGIER
ncbi:MAG: hypothetical protein Q4G34_11715 [Micrococcus sp.]|nr:hypothetical protein [Micrococcus sp.]